MKTTLCASLLASASLWALAGGAYGQPAGNAPAQVEEVVVTGSRVIANGDNMPTPVTVVTMESLKDIRPGNIVESLNDMPAFNGSRGQNTNSGTNGAAGSPASSANAVNAVNLRQLGVQRGLILFDGHRVAPSTADGTVDLDTIPQMLLKRVDVVTGGVSAVYGSDAITGVLNFITDTNFDGVKMDVQAGRSTYGDADSLEGGIAGGTSLFGGRGHIEGSFEARSQDPIDSKFARPWGKNVYTLQGFGTAAQPYYQVSGARISNLTFGGRVNNTALGDSQFTTGGLIVPFNHGTRLGLAPSFAASNNCATCEIGGDGGVFNGQLRAGLIMRQMFGRFDYDIAENVHGYLSAAYTMNRSLATGNYTSNQYTIGTDNAFLLPQYRTALGTAASFSLGKLFSEIPRGQTESHARELFVVAGLQGSVDDYKWDLAYTKSVGSFNVRANEAINQGRFWASLDSVLSNGQPVCRASLTNANYAGCVPLNPFGANAGSQAAVNYFMARQDWTTLVGMDEVAGSVSGSPVEDWAGPVSVAVSGEWRKLTYKIDSHTPDPATARADCVGIKFGCTGTTTVYAGASVASVPSVSQTVGEGAVELEVPLLKDVEFAQSLDFNGAYRFAHYDRAGDANTWKVGFTWTVNDWLSARGTRSRDFRAPTLDENFRATTTSAPGRAFGDTLPGNPDSAAGLNPNASTLNGGNPNLLPELGDTMTYGFVVKPLPGLDFSMDVFNIKVTNAIFLIQGNTPAYQNACYASGGTSASNPGTSAYCQLIVRNAQNSVTLWKQTFINLAELDTRGIDFEGGYRTTLFDNPLTARVLATYQPHLIYKQPGIADYDYAGSSFGTNGLQSNPLWRFTAFLNYKPFDTLSISLQERWRSELPKVDGAPPTASAPAIYSGSPVSAVAYTSINLTYSPEMEGSPDFYFNVQNLFNTAPPQAGFWGNPTPGQFGEVAFGDDVIGRYFTIGARARF